MVSALLRDRMLGAQFPMTLRAHQVAAIAAYEGAPDQTRCHLVLPPGSGKTLIGAQIARRAGRPVLVLAPNTAIQGQWVALWESLRRDADLDAVTVASDRDLAADVTVLTYQAVATFEDAASDDLDERQPRGLGSLHPDAAAMLERLMAGPPFTLVLDEAHHLAQAWGRLLDELLTRIQSSAPSAQESPVVIALTATPRSRLTPDQAQLTDRLFGPVLFSLPTPSLVRDEVLAPFRELVRFVEPTRVESEYLAASATRWLELTTGLLAPDFASIGFLEYLDATWVVRTVADGDPVVSWTFIERNKPQMARAVLRMHAGSQLLGLPTGARVREEHRVPPAIEDWIALISDYGCNVLLDSTQPGDQRAWESLRGALRSVGWTLTKRGARRGQSPVDKVLSRTAAKADASAALVTHEFALRGPDLRAVVITDFEHASPTPSSRLESAELENVMAASAGSAWEALVQIQASSPNLNPILMTGRTVAGAPDTLEGLRSALWKTQPQLAAGLVVEPVAGSAGQFGRLHGPRWSPRTWVPAVTAAFMAGFTQVLIGTRGLLGEGWDAAKVTTLIDLTAATTPTSVVQVRGRAIRRDPDDPEKAAHIWSVVAVSDTHPRGDLDYRRFVAKHDGFHAPDPGGRIVVGVSHVSPDCGPFQPPDAQARSKLNATMLAAAERTWECRELWGVGEPYLGLDAPVVTIRPALHRQSALDVPEAAVRNLNHPGVLLPVGGLMLGGLAPLVDPAVLAAVMPSLPAAGVCATAGAGIGLLLDSGVRSLRRRRVLASAEADGTLAAFGRAVAQGCGLVPADQVMRAVALAPDGEGKWRVWLDTTDSQAGALFANSMDQILSPIDWPRYLVSRQLPRRHAEIWHAVPDVAGRNRQAADSFHAAWVEHVSKSALHFAGSPEGAGVLAAARGLNPMDVTTALRTEWR